MFTINYLCILQTLDLKNNDFEVRKMKTLSKNKIIRIENCI